MSSSLLVVMVVRSLHEPVQMLPVCKNSTKMLLMNMVSVTLILTLKELPRQIQPLLTDEVRQLLVWRRLIKA